MQICRQLAAGKPLNSFDHLSLPARLNMTEPCQHQCQTRSYLRVTAVHIRDLLSNKLIPAAISFMELNRIGHRKGAQNRS